MNGREWVKSFKANYSGTIGEYHAESGDDGPWTTYIVGTVLEAVGNDFGCYIVSKEKPKDRGEYLNIDALFFDKAAYANKRILKHVYNDPCVIPQVAVEHENKVKDPWISYSLWKLTCLRAPVKVLICYQENADKVRELKQLLENMICEGKLMEGASGELLVIIGLANGKNKEWLDFKQYFSIFEWQGDRLDKVE